MEKEGRKTYYKPKFNQIELDKEISLIMATEDNPPNPPLSSSNDSETSTSSTETDESLEKNSFEDNPFER